MPPPITHTTKGMQTMASRNHIKKSRNCHGYTKGDKKHKLKGYTVYCSTDRRRLNKLCHAAE